MKELLKDNSRELTSRIEFELKREHIHRVEFINWKDHTVCNVLVGNIWRTKAFPVTTTIIEFLMDGGISTVNQWPAGRIYNHNQ